MSKNNSNNAGHNKQADRLRVDPLGDLKIAEARGKNDKMRKVTVYACRFLGADQEGDVGDDCQDQVEHRCRRELEENARRED